jgi:hypothetical protein
MSTGNQLDTGFPKTNLGWILWNRGTNPWDEKKGYSSIHADRNANVEGNPNYQCGTCNKYATPLHQKERYGPMVCSQCYDN